LPVAGVPDTSGGLKKAGRRRSVQSMGCAIAGKFGSVQLAGDRMLRRAIRKERARVPSPINGHGLVDFILPGDPANVKALILDQDLARLPKEAPRCALGRVLFRSVAGALDGGELATQPPAGRLGGEGLNEFSGTWQATGPERARVPRGLNCDVHKTPPKVNTAGDPGRSFILRNYSSSSARRRFISATLSRDAFCLAIWQANSISCFLWARSTIAIVSSCE
jgi:hypothetical protein